MSLSALYLTRVGQLACYDRVVFDINGPRHAELPETVGFTARYLRAPIYGTDDQGHQSWRPAPKIGPHQLNDA
jgi:hypothetical protein